MTTVQGSCKARASRAARIASLLLLIAMPEIAFPQQADIKKTIANIEQDLVSLRGLPFKQSVPIAQQSEEAFGRHVDKEMAEAVPPAIAGHFGKIVRRLGLYRGPEISDFGTMMRTVMTSQAAAYYDPDARRIYILAEGGSDLERSVIYAHELYHGLQDQYFDLNAYLPKTGKFNADQAMARQAVVEGEATYIHTLWVVRNITGSNPPRAMMAPAIRMQADLTVEQLRGMVGASEQGAMAELDNIPPFILETLLGNYLKGAAFVFAVQEQGWAAVESLYKDSPPLSTEQILHPEKWLAREAPSDFTWPDLRKARALADWELLDNEVLGEFQWRIVFKVHGLQADAEAAAAGWDGDRYAVFKRKGSDETLLLLRTSWDDEAQAAQFAEGYRRLLAVKYQGMDEATRVDQQGSDVFIVEGGRKTDLDDLVALVKQATRIRATTVASF